MSDQSLIPALPTKERPITQLTTGRYRIVEHVTRTVLHQQDEIPFHVEFQGPIRVSEIDPVHSKYKDRKTGESTLPEIADVLNLITGECQLLIVNTVMGSEIRRKYPNDGYVGRCFAMVRRRSDQDKRYKEFHIIEIARVVDENSGKTTGVEKVAEFHAGVADVDKTKRKA